MSVRKFPFLIRKFRDMETQLKNISSCGTWIAGFYGFQVAGFFLQQRRKFPDMIPLERKEASIATTDGPSGSKYVLSKIKRLMYLVELGFE